MRCLTNDQVFKNSFFPTNDMECSLCLYVCVAGNFIQKCLPQIYVNVWCSLDYCKVFQDFSVEACDVS